MKVIAWILGLAAAGFILLMAVGAATKKPHVSGYTQINGKWVIADEGDRKDAARNGIANCWSDQARKSLAPDVARTVAGMCEGMEATFMQDYKEKP